jgi:tetratricopeptide (TPR) repeat protein
VVVAGVLLGLATLAAYYNSFSGPFVYDDVPAIKDNPTIRHLGNIAQVLSPPSDSGITVNGRPLVNLTLAINYAIGGTTVTSYHVLNLIIHLGACLALFGLVRRTLQLPGLRERFDRGGASLPLAFSTALLWALHPLQTEAVTYIIQRAESLVGLFYILTFYCFVRSVTSPQPKLWQGLSIAACFCGMASKEVMASAPLLVLLYDRAIVSGTFREAWRRHFGLYLGLAASWVILAGLVSISRDRGGTAGFGAGGTSSWHYALTSAYAIGTYVKLCFWPSPLVFDYGTAIAKELRPVLPQAILIVSGVIATGYALWRRPLLGFIGIWFFAILGPSSSIIPIASEPIAEHRMYLPLAALVALVVVGCGHRLGRLALPAFAVLGIVAGWLTFQRNRDYRDELTLWRDAQTKYPTGARAHNNVGEILYRQGKMDEAIACFREAVRLLPNYIDALNNLGNSLTEQGDVKGALQFLDLALRLKPGYSETLNNLGNAYYKLGHKEDAVVKYREAIKARPGFADPHNNLGVVIAELGQNDEAIKEYEIALRLKPDYLDAHYNYGNVLNQVGRKAEAVAQFETALKLKPTHPEAHNNLGGVLYNEGKVQEALQHYEIAVRNKENYPDAQNNLGVALVNVGRQEEAVRHFEAAVRFKPGFIDALNNYAEVQNTLGAKAVADGDLNAAKDHFARAIAANPQHVGAHNNMGVVLWRGGQPALALPYFEKAVRLNPDYADAQTSLTSLRAALGIKSP